MLIFQAKTRHFDISTTLKMNHNAEVNMNMLVYFFIILYRKGSTSTTILIIVVIFTECSQSSKRMAKKRKLEALAIQAALRKNSNAGVKISSKQSSEKTTKFNKTTKDMANNQKVLNINFIAINLSYLSMHILASNW